LTSPEIGNCFFIFIVIELKFWHLREYDTPIIQKANSKFFGEVIIPRVFIYIEMYAASFTL
jgi:hypothetical protein